MLLVIFLITFTVVGCGLLFAFSVFGGWGDLARRFPAAGKPPGQYYRFRSARVGGIGYMNVLTVGVCDEGLYLGVLFLFRLAHPPLLIPWSEVTEVRVDRSLLGSTCQVRIGQPEVACVILPEEAEPAVHAQVGEHLKAM